MAYCRSCSIIAAEDTTHRRKSQIPKYKSQTKSNIQVSNLRFEICLGFGACDLGFTRSGEPFRAKHIVAEQQERRDSDGGEFFSIGQRLLDGDAARFDGD